MNGYVNYNANFSSVDNRIMCVIEDDKIYQLSTNAKMLVGRIEDSFLNLESVTQEYYNKLVELGEIIPEKTESEILRETQEALLESQKMNAQMLELLKEIKGGISNNVQSTNNNEPIIEDVSEQSE